MGLLKQLTKTVLETALNEDLTEHLGYDNRDPAGRDSGNIRNGTRPKTVLTEARRVTSRLMCPATVLGRLVWVTAGSGPDRFGRSAGRGAS